MGRFLVFLWLVVLIVPALLLWRLWRYAGHRRQVSAATLSFVLLTVPAERTLARWPGRARVLRVVGLGAGLLIIVALALSVGTRSVFAWPLALGLGYLLGVLAGELTRPRPHWEVRRGRPGRLSDYLHPGLVWSMRGAALLTIAVALMVFLFREPPAAGTGLRLPCAGGGFQLIGAGHLIQYVAILLALPVAGWVVSEVTLLLRIVRAPTAAEPDDVPVDEALRSASAHASVAAATVLILLPLGGSALVTGLTVASSCVDSDLLSIGSIAGGLAALLAGLLVAAFLPNWLRPVQRRADVRS